jgi:hypothetical protein
VQSSPMDCSNQRGDRTHSYSANRMRRNVAVLRSAPGHERTLRLGSEKSAQRWEADIRIRADSGSYGTLWVGHFCREGFCTRGAGRTR